MSTSQSDSSAPHAPFVPPITADFEPVARKVERIQLQMLFEQLNQGLIATLINASLLAWVLSSVSDKATTGIWFGLMAAVCAGRFALLHHYLNEDDEAVNIRLWRNRFVAGAVATAALWGSAGIVLFPATSYQHQAFIGFVLAGMAAGASGSMVADDRVFRLYIALAITPYMLRLGFEGQSVNVAMAIMSAAFIVALSLSSRKNTRSAMEALRLRFENQGLVAELKDKANQLRDANDALKIENAEREKTAADLL